MFLSYNVPPYTKQKVTPLVTDGVLYKCTLKRCFFSSATPYNVILYTKRPAATELAQDARQQQRYTGARQKQ